MAPARLAPGLYLVATPIGNDADLSPRARDVLTRAGAVLAEDTRRAGL
ncbi:MAG: 16S rRNA (cytidine(1402)-2'-O)-methyltransferase, partial [Humidesulfovibrio sp.]|nr:16S rRNA (cytidine(1402)-2'-O)-methyltransferase [Humidesulfovibrio sp.]